MADHEDREHFIPIRKTELVDLLCKTPVALTAAEQHDFRQFCRLVDATFHFEYQRDMDRLKDLYAPFDPDTDTVCLQRPVDDDTQQRLNGLVAKFEWLLERGNYRRLAREELDKALQETGLWGLNFHVNFEIFDRLELFYRGDATRERVLPRRWFGLRKERRVPIRIFQRLVVLLRFRKHPALPRNVDFNNVYIKEFKDIPRADLEMLVPGTRPKMRIWDQGKIGFPLLTGLGITGYRLAGGALLLAAGVANIFAWLGLIGGTVGYGVKSYFGYLNTRNKYQLTLTESLFFQNLDNNAGVLFRLCDDALEQECREAFLAYYFLWREAGDNGWTDDELDDRVEQFLEQAAGLKVDFEIGDAMHKLRRLRVIEQAAADRIRAVPIAAALANLDQAWDNFFQYHRADSDSPS